jgi:NADH-quinone oxidoreductase subunit E
MNRLAEEGRTMALPFGKLDTILDLYSPSPENLISVLQDIQAEFGYIPREALWAVCDHLDVPLSRGWAVTTFYKAFRLEAKGEHEICVCLGTACHLKGGRRIVENLSRRLGIEAGNTTKDLKFTLETVNCLGTCALAPVTVIDKKYQPNVTSQKLNKIVNRLSKE